MNDSLETYLSAALKRLEQAAAELMKTRGVSREAEAVKALVELTREQVRDENPRSSNRQAG